MDKYELQNRALKEHGVFINLDNKDYTEIEAREILKEVGEKKELIEKTYRKAMEEQEDD